MFDIDTNPGKKVWDEIYSHAGRVLTDPHEEMPQIVERLLEREASTILDLGSGNGRHVVYLAERGFQVYGLEYSPHAVEVNRQWLQEKGLHATLQIGDMTMVLPYEDEFFDAVISIQVIHHTQRENIDRLILEIERVLRPGGLLFVTVPSCPHQHIKYDEIAPNTYVQTSGSERGLVHYYFTPVSMLAAFEHFRIEDLHMDSSQHYCLTALSKKGES